MALQNVLPARRQPWRQVGTLSFGTQQVLPAMLNTFPVDPHQRVQMLLVCPAEMNVAAPPTGLAIGTRVSLERNRLLEQAANGYDAPLATTPK